MSYKSKRWRNSARFPNSPANCLRRRATQSIRRLPKDKTLNCCINSISREYRLRTNQDFTIYPISLCWVILLPSMRQMRTLCQFRTFDITPGQKARLEVISVGEHPIRTLRIVPDHPTIQAFPDWLSIDGEISFCKSAFLTTSSSILDE